MEGGRSGSRKIFRRRECAGDLLGGEPGDRAQSQCHLRLLRESRVAAREDQPEAVVGDRCHVLLQLWGRGFGLDLLSANRFTFDDSQQARLIRSPHRYIWPAELDLMAQLAGFELESRHADWSGSEFTAESRSHVSVYRLPTTQ